MEGRGFRMVKTSIGVRHDTWRFRAESLTPADLPALVEADRESRRAPGEMRTGEVRPRHAGSRRSAPSWRACGDGRGSPVEEGGLRWRS